MSYVRRGTLQGPYDKRVRSYPERGFPIRGSLSPNIIGVVRFGLLGAMSGI